MTMSFSTDLRAWKAHGYDRGASHLIIATYGASDESRYPVFVYYGQKPLDDVVAQYRDAGQRILGTWRLDPTE
jgi:hypothetical protein